MTVCNDQLAPHIIGIVLGPAALFGGALLFLHARRLSDSGMRAVFGYVPDGTAAFPYHPYWGYSWGSRYWPTLPMPPLYRYYGCFTMFFALWTTGISAYGLWTNATCSPDHDIFLGYAVILSLPLSS